MPLQFIPADKENRKVNDYSLKLIKYPNYEESKQRNKQKNKNVSIINTHKHVYLCTLTTVQPF